MITHNKAPFLEISVPAISSSISRDDVEFIILDNGSTDGTSDLLLDMSRNFDLKVHRIKEHIGLNAYSIVTNMASGKIVVTADDDIFCVDKGWEDAFIAALSSKFGEDNRLFGYVGLEPQNEDGGQSKIIHGIAEVGGVNIAICPVGGWFTATTRAVISQIGGFHSGMPLMYLEDADFQSRAAQHGYLVGMIRNVNVYHARSPYFYELLDCVDVYNEKAALAKEVDIDLDPIA